MTWQKPQRRRIEKSRAKHTRLSTQPSHSLVFLFLRSKKQQLRCAVDVSMHATDGLWFLWFVVAALRFLVLGLAPLFVLFLFVFVCFLLVLRPFFQWIMHRHLFDILSQLAREALTYVSASFALISTTRKILYNDQAKAIVALEPKKAIGQPAPPQCFVSSIKCTMSLVHWF